MSIFEPAAIDPGLTQDIEGAQVTRLLIQALVSLSPDLEVVPGVATAWSVGADGLTWTFTLSDQAKFSDGRPVVAADFVFAFARTADPDLASPSAYQGLPIAGWAAVNSGEPSGAIGDVAVEGLAAVDDHTLTIRTDQPFALLPKLLTYPIFAPVAPEYVDTKEKADAFGQQPIGNGPYRMTSPWKHNVGMTLERSPEFAGTPGIVDTIEFKIYSDLVASFRDFEEGNLDIVRGTPAPEIVNARTKYGDRFLETETGTLTYIGFPTNVAPFDNPDIRRALSMAINRQAIVDDINSGAGTPATGMVPPAVPGALTTTCDACIYDSVKAKTLFNQAGGIPGNKMVVYDIADDGRDALDPIINSWREVFGLEIEVRSFEFAEFLEETATGIPVGPFELGWVWDYPSGYSILSPLFESTSESNNLSWSDADFDAAVASARAVSDEAMGLPFLTAAQSIVEAEMPLAPVTFGTDLGAYSSRLSGVVVDAGALWRLELIQVTG